jgi:hypothetical protein
MAKTALITPRDVLAPADETVVLEIEVERRGWPFFDPPIEGAEVEVEGRGRARTDATGVAILPLGVLPPGDHVCAASSEGARGEALVRVIPREAPVLITDIDHTIADVSSAGFILRSNEGVRPIPGSAEALREIAKRYSLVYLTARDHIFAGKTKAWLAMNGFPPGPVYLRRGTRFWTVKAREHKVSRLRELRLRFPNLRAGVGDLLWDLEAYAAHGIPGILLSPRPPASLPAGAVAFPDWPAIADHVLKP